MTLYRLEPGEYPEKPRKNSDTEFTGNGWRLLKLKGTFILNYVSGSLQGEEKELEITLDEYNQMIEGKLTLDELCKKYNVT